MTEIPKGGVGNISAWQVEFAAFRLRHAFTPEVMRVLRAVVAINKIAGLP